MARLFNGTTQRLNKGSAVLTAYPMTFACWYNATNFTASATLIEISQSATALNYFNMFVTTTALLAVRVESAGVGAQANSVATLTAGTWAHCVGVFASATSRVCYLNNVSSTNVTNNTPANTVNDTGIGAGFNVIGTVSNFAAGSIAFARIFNVALSAADVAADFAAGPRLVQPSTLVSYLRLTGNSSPEPDLVSSTTWTLTAAPTESANPRIYFP